MENRIKELEKEVGLIKNRNKKVEADKAWEISFERKIFIAVSTYLLISLLMLTLETENPFLSALIPTCGYLISTFSLSFIKDKWIKVQKHK